MGPQDTNRWTKENVTPGEDPREIDQEQQDPDAVRHVQRERQVTHGDQPQAEDRLGTSSSTYDPTERR